jgi:asparagine synthase (glutamine-hydrolysing)
MQQSSNRPIRTFTIGFQEDRFDEARHARQVAAHLGTDHTEIRLTPNRALDVIPRLPEIYDEPFADPSQIPMIMVSAMAREHVTVALSGDGGDELFFGYGRYTDAQRIWQRIGSWPAGVRQTLAPGLAATGRAIGGHFGFRLNRLGHRIDAASFDAYYTNLLSLSMMPTATDGWPTGLPGDPDIPARLVAQSRRMMFADQCSYLPEDILTKTDRASMAASLELRVPLIDHRIVEFAWRMPDRLLWDDRSGKILLRHLLYRHIPRELVDRPKQGFEIPLDDWLRGSLREWMLDLLTPTIPRDDGLLDTNTVSTLVAEHLSGRANHGLALWPALMFEAWQQCYR